MPACVHRPSSSLPLTSVQDLPVVFVGPLRRLDAVVDLMAAEVAAVFKAAKRPLPPWRTKGAMMSKWAPAQLGELERFMRCAASTQQQQQALLQLPGKANSPEKAQAQQFTEQVRCLGKFANAN